MSTDFYVTVAIVGFLVFIAFLAWIDFKRYQIQRDDYARFTRDFEDMRQRILNRAPEWTHRETVKRAGSDESEAADA